MSYIGNTPFTAAFLTDTFSGNGTTVAFTMSAAPANTSSILVAVTGVVQDPSTYSVSGTTLTFSAAPPSGTSNISVRYLGIPASGVTTTAYRTQTEFTATAGQTTFTVPSYTVGYIDVYRNGLLLGSADFTATTGTTVVLAAAASAGDFIETVSFYVSSVLNAIQQYNGLSVNQVLTTPTANTLTSASGSNLQLQTNGGTTALTLDTAQNAGLGVTPSAWGSASRALQMQSGMSLFSNTSGLGGLGNNVYSIPGTGDYYIANGYATRYYQYNGTHVWNTAASGTAGNAISFTQAMTLDASGNLALGTTSAGTRLEVVGTGATLSGTAKLVARFVQDTTTYRGVVLGYDSSGQIGIIYPESAGAASNLAFWTYSGSAWAERARIDSSGSLLVGTTTNVGNRPLQVYTSGNIANAYLNAARSTAGSEEILRIEYTAAAPNSSTSWFIYANDTASQRFSVRSNGGIANFSANNVNLSDRREKTNFAPAGDYLAKICAIPVQTFNYIDQNMEEDGGLTLGVVAQDVQAVAPELVMESNWANKDEEPKMRLSIYQTDLQYALMKCIQEQQAIIEQLQADVAALKGQA